MHKPLCLIADHIKMMGVRIQYFLENQQIGNDELVNENRALEDGIIILRNRYIKQVMKQMNDADRLKTELEALFRDYKRLINQFILALE